MNADSFYRSVSYKPDLSASDFKIIRKGLKLSIVIEKFYEFWSCKTIIDFSNVNRQDHLQKWLRPVRKCMLNVEETLVARYNRHQISRSIDRGVGRENLTKALQEVSYSASLALYAGNNELLPAIRNPSCTDQIASPSQMFANFVGFSLGIDIGEPADGGDGRASRFSPHEFSSVTENIMPARSFNPKDTVLTTNLVEAAWPLIKSINPYCKYDIADMLETLSEVKFQSIKEKREFTISDVTP